MPPLVKYFDEAFLAYRTDDFELNDTHFEQNQVSGSENIRVWKPAVFVVSHAQNLFKTLTFIFKL